MLAGIGFTVSLLMGELAFGTGSKRDEHVKVAVVVGSVLAALVAGRFLRLRARRYMLLTEQVATDIDADGIPDVHDAEEEPSPPDACAAPPVGSGGVHRCWTEAGGRAEAPATATLAPAGGADRVLVLLGSADVP